MNLYFKMNKTLKDIVDTSITLSLALFVSTSGLSCKNENPIIESYDTQICHAYGVTIPIYGEQEGLIVAKEAIFYKDRTSFIDFTLYSAGVEISGHHAIYMNKKITYEGSTITTEDQ